MALLYALGASCGGEEAPAPRVLELELVLPDPGAELLLNAPLDFYFSAEIDASSVPAAFRIRRPGGEPARGRFEVDGSHVRFVPAPALAADLSDGGFRLNSTYEVSIVGFPAADTLRGSEGEPLARRLTFEFRTVGLPADEEARVFADDSPERAAPIYLLTDRIGPGDALLFLCREEAIHPLSLGSADFHLQRRGAGGEVSPPVPLDARLIERFRFEPGRLNRNLLPFLQADRYGEFHIDPEHQSLLELRPRARLEDGTYSLISPSGSLLQDRGGNPMPIFTPDEIRVDDDLGDDWRGEFVETFLDADILSPVPVPGVDGTAHWAETGRVAMRYPAAAGDGHDGELELAGDEPRHDVHAVELEVPPRATARLTARPGRLVLRSQAAMRIRGTLLRELESGGAASFTPSDPFSGEGTLSRWLKSIESHPAPGWTVLVAGGDLWIEGSLRVDTPLLLAAGGVIRVTGRVEAPVTYLLGRGGGPGLAISTPTADLELDSPKRNPLVRPLRVAALSAPIPPRGRVRRWTTAEAEGWPAVSDGEGAGWRVRYVPEDLPLSGEPLRAVDHPWQIPGSGAIRLLVELEVAPTRTRFPWWLPIRPGPGSRPVFLEWTSRWEPPFVDTVHLKWE